MGKSLSENWFLEGSLDFEYKKYLLLAYLQHVSREFAEVRLYPSFSDLIFHYNNLHSYHNQKQAMQGRFPRSLDEEAIRQLELRYESDVQEEEEFLEIDSLVTYALPTLKQHIQDGKEIYDYIENQIQIEPIGITPLYKREGYIFLRVPARSFVKVFEYRIIFLENADVNHYGIAMEYIDHFRQNLTFTLQSRKQQLIRERTGLPNPATWLVHTPAPFPEEAALLPVTKRKMLSFIKQQDAA